MFGCGGCELTSVKNRFRDVLSHYPTGVCVVSSMQTDGVPIGLAVGSFTSISLEPPLVGFFPDRNSSSWPKIQKTGRFCVNILSHDQEWLCRRFASKAFDKFENINYRLSNNGLPIIDDVLAWIDCTIYAVHEAGDHYIAVGEVASLSVERDATPLIFCQGSYGDFNSTASQNST